MFFTMTAAIGGALAAAAWSIQDGPTIAALVAGAAGVANAAAAAILVAQVDRRATATGPEAGTKPAADDIPRLRRRRIAPFAPAR